MDRTGTLTLNTAEGTTKLESSCLLVFIDETGHECFSDPQYPVFGLGGCAVPVAEYTSHVHIKWKEMKKLHFGGADVSMHANELRSPLQNQLDALSNFFKMDCFTRVVSIASAL